MTIAEAERRRLIDSLTEQRILEAQAATGGIIDPSSQERLTPRMVIFLKSFLLDLQF